MCQSLAQGGRRCPAHQPATLGVKDYCRTIFKLHKNQVDYSFKNLRKQGAEHPAPTRSQYNALIRKMKQNVDTKVTDTASKNRMHRQLDKHLEDTQLPDGPTFFALKKMIPRSRDQRSEIAQAIRSFCQERGVTRTEAYEKLNSYYNDPNNVSLSNIYGDTLDARTRQALSSMSNDPVNADIVSSEPRISEYETSSSHPDYRYGYDPDDGRLEIEVYDNVYAYHNVPASMYDAMDESAPSILRTLTDSQFFSYASTEEAIKDTFGRWCRECHSYKAASGHVCEPSEEEDTMDAEEILEIIRAENPDEEVTLEAAQKRIRNALRDNDENEVTNVPSRRRTRMTARRRLWTAPLEDRETVSLSNQSNSSPATGGHGRMLYYPDPALIKSSATEGKIVKVKLDRHINSPSYARDFGANPNIVMSHDLEFYCDDITGDVKMRKSGEGYCDCQEFRRNNTCRHIRSQDNPDLLNRSFQKDIKGFHQKVDQLSYMRQEAAAGRLDLMKFNANSQSFTYDGHSLQMPLPSQSAIRNARQILSDGGEVAIQNLNGFVDSRHVEGGIKYEGSPENLGVSVSNSLRCENCGREDCGHVQTLVSKLNEIVVPNDSVLLNFGSKLSQLDSVETSDWQSKPDEVGDVLSKFSVGIDRSYTANLDKYLSDYREAREKVNRGESPLPYATEDVTNGICAPGKKAFGVEIEFDLGSRSDYRSLDRIAQEMYDAGLSEAPYMQRWHYNARTATPYSHWSLERDATVAGEIVSPILHDTPETWENLKTLCDIIKRNGGEASLRAGQHIHMGTINRRGTGSRASRATLAEKNANILHFYAAHEDSIRRVQTDPARGRHRNNEYCSPLSEDTIQTSVYHFKRGNSNLGSNHASSVNFGFNDRIEFRGADCSLDPAHIQAQVMMTAGIVSAAERGELDYGERLEKLKHQKVGTNAKRLEAIKLSSGELNDDELIVSDASYRNFITSLFDTDHARKMMVGIAANTPWQK